MNCEKMSKLINCASAICEKKTAIIEKFIAPFILLWVRVFVALVFWKSGMVKFSNLDSTILLFEYEYEVPFLSPVFAAYSATFFEIVCSALLIVGLGSRIAALLLIVMTLVIQFSVVQNPEHFYWLALLSVVVASGPGLLSLDAIVKKRFSSCSVISKNKKK